MTSIDSKEKSGWWQLVRHDPGAAFADRKLWPRSIPADAARETTERWESFVGGSFGPAQALWKATWPLPIGQRAVFDALGPLVERGIQADLVALASAMPFDGEEYAAFIFECDIRGVHVEMFGLAIPEGADPDFGRVFTIGPAKFVVRSDGPIPTGISKLTTNMLHWWRVIGTGLLPGPGRPSDTRYRTLSDYRQAYRDAAKALGRTHMTQVEFVDCTRIPFDTMRDNFRGWGITWTEFRREMAEE